MGEAGLLGPYDPKTLKQIGPIRPQVAFGDYCAGMYAAFSILVAMQAREKTGRGQYIDVSMIDTALSWRQDMAMYDCNAMETFMQTGPYGPFQTKDTWVTICANRRHFAALCQVLGLTRPR